VSPLQNYQRRSREVGCGHQGGLKVTDEILALLKARAVDCKSLGLHSRSFIWSGLKCHGCRLQRAASRAPRAGEKLAVIVAVPA